MPSWWRSMLIYSLHEIEPVYWRYIRKINLLWWTWGLFLIMAVTALESKHVRRCWGWLVPGGCYSFSGVLQLYEVTFHLSMMYWTVTIGIIPVIKSTMQSDLQWWSCVVKLHWFTMLYCRNMSLTWHYQKIIHSYWTMSWTLRSVHNDDDDKAKHAFIFHKVPWWESSMFALSEL